MTEDPHQDAPPKADDPKSERAPGRAHDVISALLYRRVRALDPKRFAETRLRGDSGFSFAEETHVVPLMTVEFGAAARHYPIVFNNDDVCSPVAIVGVTDRHNLFVDTGGGWAEGCYIPAFIRRYPFILLRGGAESEDLQLCVDAEALHLSEEGAGLPLFTDGKPASIVDKIGRFNAAYMRETLRTRAFSQACQDQGLMIDRAVDYPLPDGRKLRLRGFKVIDPDRLRGLPDDQVVHWWRNGFLPLAVAHLTSLGNFGRLFHRAHRQAEQELANDPFSAA